MHPATLKLFLEVADLGSFSKAAIARRTVQSHISGQVPALIEHFSDIDVANVGAFG
jgi:DNA-binding transcriptional LysR family regulator